MYAALYWNLNVYNSSLIGSGMDRKYPMNLFNPGFHVFDSNALFLLFYIKTNPVIFYFQGYFFVFQQNGNMHRTGRGIFNNILKRFLGNSNKIYFDVFLQLDPRNFLVHLQLIFKAPYFRFLFQQLSEDIGK